MREQGISARLAIRLVEPGGQQSLRPGELDSFAAHVRIESLRIAPFHAAFRDPRIKAPLALPRKRIGPGYSVAGNKSAAVDQPFEDIEGREEVVKKMVRARANDRHVLPASGSAIFYTPELVSGA